MAVLRTSNLWSDVASLEALLGGDPQPFLESDVKHTHGSESYQVKSGVSPDGAISLCCALRHELAVYKDLIMAAVNINESEKEATLRQTLQRCGKSRELSVLEVWGYDWMAWDCQSEEIDGLYLPLDKRLFKSET